MTSYRIDKTANTVHLVQQQVSSMKKFHVHQSAKYGPVICETAKPLVGLGLQEQGYVPPSMTLPGLGTMPVESLHKWLTFRSATRHYYPNQRQAMLSHQSREEDIQHLGA